MPSATFIVSPSNAASIAFCIVAGDSTLNVFPVPVASDAAVPPITSSVSSVISNVFELISMLLIMPSPFPAPTLIALNPQLLNVLFSNETPEIS